MLYYSTMGTWSQQVWLLSLNIRARLTTVYIDTGPRHEGGTLRGQECHHRRNFFGFAKAPQRHLIAHEILDEHRIFLLAPLPRAAWEQDGTWRHYIYHDTVFGKLLGKRFGPAIHARLHGVVGHRPTRLASIDRRNVDDTAPAAFAHERNHQARGPHRREEVEVQGFRPVLVGRIPGLSAPRATDVIHQDIDTVKAFDGFVDEVLNPLGAGHVSLHCQDLRTCSRDLTLSGAQSRLSARREGHVTAFLGEIMHNSPANVPAAFGDQRDFALQSQIHTHPFRTTFIPRAIYAYPSHSF